jgi:hypothetical protein
MNTKGETVPPLTKYSEKDVKIVGKYYPYPFQYNEKEKIFSGSLINKINCWQFIM